MPIDKSFSRGNFWSIVTTITMGGGILVSVAIAYSEVGSQADENTRGIAANRTALESTDRRLRALEQSSARSDERYTALLSIMQDVAARLERFEQRLWGAEPRP